MNLRRNVRTKKKIGLLTKTNTEIGPNLETSGVMATRLNRVYPFAAGRLGPVLCQVANMAAASESDAASQVGVAPSEGDASSVPAPTAAGSLASAPTGWHLTPLTSDQKAAADSMQAILDDFDNRVLGDYGGPAQFLRAKLSSRESISAFGSWLWSTFPLSGNMEYSLCKSDVKQVRPEELGSARPCRVHVSMLGFGAAASLKPDPSRYAASKLASHIITSGFLSGVEPLEVKLLEDSDLPEGNGCPWSTDVGPDGLPTFCLGFSKGMLRASTLLALLCQWWSDGMADLLLQTLDKLRKSLKCVFVYFTKHNTLEHEVFHNFRTSLRGSIRKPPNLLTWVGVLDKLRNKGYEDAAAVISRFNLTVAKSSQLVGTKANTVANLLFHFDEELVSLLQSHVSKYGWENCALSDDNLSSKKILPNYVHKAPHKQWKTFCTMSLSVTKLLFQRLFADYARNPASRKKLVRASLDDLSETAALVWNLAKMLCEQFPIPMAVAEAEILKKWVDANSGLELELHEVAVEKRQSLNVNDIRFFRDVIESHQGKTPVVDSGAVELQLSQLDFDKYQLTVKQLDYDIQAFRTYKSKLNNYDTNVHHTKVDWRKKRQEEAKQWVLSWLAKKCSMCCFDETQEGALLQVLQDASTELLRRSGLNERNVASCRYSVSSMSVRIRSNFYDIAKPQPQTPDP